jgi:hypothetical protein
MSNNIDTNPESKNGAVDGNSSSALSESKIIDICMRNVPNWNAFNPADLQLRVLTGGLSNSLFVVSIKNEVKSSHDKNSANAYYVPQEVVFRIFGQGCFYDRTNESKIVKAMSEFKISEIVYHEFDQGTDSVVHM